MAYTYPATVDFGPLYSGLTGTIGYQLYNADGTANGSRVTSGITELGTGTGIYNVQLSLSETWRGSILWDTGGGSPIYAVERIGEQQASGLLFESVVVSYETSELATALYIAGGPNQSGCFNRATVVVYDASNNNAPCFRQIVISEPYEGNTYLNISSAFSFTPEAGDMVRIVLNPREIALIPIYDPAKTAEACATAILATPAYKLVTDASGAVVTDSVSRAASKNTASEIRGAVGLATANLDTQLAGISGGIGGTGTGARTVVIIVNDGTTALESASVRLTKGAETYVSSTNASGQISFSLDDGTWSVAITLAGYTFAPTTLVVDGDKTQTYSMMLATVTPSEVSKVTGYWYTLDEEGEVEASVDIELRVVSSSLAGTAHDAAIRTETSDSNGLVQFTNLVKGAKYEARRGTTTRWTQFTVPTTATTPYALPDIWGSEEG